MNKCWNCKHSNFPEYGDTQCMFNYRLDSSNGTYIKVYKEAASVRKDLEHCPHYEHSFFMKIKIRIGMIQQWWYSKYYPEKLL